MWRSRPDLLYLLAEISGPQIRLEDLIMHCTMEEQAVQEVKRTHTHSTSEFVEHVYFTNQRIYNLRRRPMHVMAYMMLKATNMQKLKVASKGFAPSMKKMEELSLFF